MARKPLKRRGPRHLNEAAIAAWKACDYEALHRALGLHPAKRSPLPLEVTPLGVGEDSFRGDGTAWDESCAAALELQRQFLEAVGRPDCRSTYQEQLQEAEERMAHARTLVREDRDRDLALRELKAARENLAWRKELLAEL